MAIKSLEEQRKHQKILLVVGLGILIIAGLILYFTFWRETGIISLEERPTESERTGTILEEKLKKIELDFSFLTQTIIPFLKIHGQIPVEKGTTGRTNPFIPY